MNGHANILVVDDERRIREVVEYALVREGYTVRTATSVANARVLLAQEPADLVVLDIMLPGESGLEYCRELTSTGQAPVLFLSARSDEIDRVVGLELGADDYLSKPFGTRELTARVKAVLRRAVRSAKTEGSATGQILIGRLCLDAGRHEVVVGSDVVHLTHTEFLILRALMRRPDMVYERPQLMRAARSDDSYVTERTVDTHVRRIRAKLLEHGLSPIATVHGVGYKLVAASCSE